MANLVNPKIVKLRRGRPPVTSEWKITMRMLEVAGADCWEFDDLPQMAMSPTYKDALIAAFSAAVDAASGS